MPSLKDLRDRINSVKSTQKITSAMKMVAASKLRRAQSQAEAARPYAERMERMLRALAASVADMPDAPPLLAGTGKRPDLSAGAGHRRSRPGRRVQRQHRPRHPHAGAPAGGAKARPSRSWRSAARAATICGASLPAASPATSPTPASAASSSRDAEEVGSRITAMLDAGEIDVCILIYNRFRSVISQIVTEQQLIPVAAAAEGEADRSRRRGLRVRAGRGDHPGAAAAADAGDPDLSRAAGECRRRARRAHDRDGQRDPQRRRHDQAPDAELQPGAPGQHHQGTDRDHLRRRSRSESEAQSSNGKQHRRPRDPGDGRRRGRAVRRRAAVHPERAAHQARRPHAGAGSGAGTRRAHRALHRHGQHRRHRARPGGGGHRRRRSPCRSDRRRWAASST